METLEDRIKAFVSLSSGSGDGNECGCGFGSGYGSFDVFGD